MSETSSIILTGEILPEREFGEVASALARVLRTTEDIAAKLLVGRETVIKRNVPNAEVGRYLHVIGRAGAVVRAARAPVQGQAVRAAEPLPAAPPAPVPREESGAASASVKPALALAEECVVCPDCRHHQPKRTLCQKCGCDMVAVRAAREQAEQEERERTAGGAFKMPDVLPVDAVEQNDEVRAPGAIGVWARGRIGRLRLIAYLWPVLALLVLLMVVSAQTFQSRENGGVSPWTIAFVLAVAVFGAMAYMRVAVSRGRELDWKWLPPFVLLLLCATLAPGLVKFGSVPATVVMLTLTIVPLCLWLLMRVLALRLHDINLSGKWLLLLVVVPIAGVLLGRPGLALVGSSLFWIVLLLLAVLPGSGEENAFGPACAANSVQVKVGATAVVLLVALGVYFYKLGVNEYQERVAGNSSTGANGRHAGASGKALDFSNPVYAEIRVKRTMRGENIEMVYLGKTTSEADCMAQLASFMTDDHLRRCRSCELVARQCRFQLRPTEQSMFDKEPIHTTYLAADKGSPEERDWRMVVWGLTAAQSGRVCQDMKESSPGKLGSRLECVSGLSP